MKLSHRGAVLVAVLCIVAGLRAGAPASAAPSEPNGGSRPLWSPDGKRIAFVSGTPNMPANVWMVGVRRGERPHQITRLGARLLAWAPDGRSVYCQTMRGGRSAFYAADVTSGRERAILGFLSPDITEVAFSPDRRSVAYLKKHNDHRDLWAAATDGRTRRQLSEGLKTRSMDWSRDGRTIAFDAGGIVGETTYAVEVSGKSQPRVVFTGIGSYPSWSPDGSRIAVLGMHSVTVVSRDGSSKRRLHVSQDSRHALSWSPDGTHLAYTSVDRDLFGISIVNVRSGEAVRVSSGWKEAAFPRWSPDGRRLAFAAVEAKAYASDIYILDVHQQRRLKLTNSYASSWESKWSGDGTSLYAVSNVAGADGYSLCRGAADGKSFRSLFPIDPSRPLQLNWPQRSKTGIVVTDKQIWLLESTRNPRVIATTEHPTWAALSPTGASLAYVKWRNHQSSLVLAGPDGKGEKELLAPPAPGLAYSHVAWSPLGKEVLFVRGGALCKVPAGGGTVSVLFAPAKADAKAVTLAPLYSSQGTWIALGRVLQAGGQYLEIRLVRSDGTGTKVIAKGRFVAEGGVYADPLADAYAWSPDGKHLAFSQELDGRPAVYLVSVNGGSVGRPRLLTGSAAYPSWTPDGKRVAYTDLSGNRESIRMVRLRDGVDRLVSLRPDSVATGRSVSVTAARKGLARAR